MKHGDASTMRKKPQILGTRTLARTRLFQIEQVDLRFSNGVETQYERLRGSADGAVLIVAMPSTEEVLLVREYAAGSDRYELGFPKGRIEPGEAIVSAADRELQEEIGFGARQLDHIGSVTLAPGYFSHTTHLVIARDLFASRQSGDEPEELEVVRWKLDDLGALLREEDLTEARSIAALYMVRDWLRG